MEITEKMIKDYMISQDVTFGWDNNIKEFEVSSFCRIYGKRQLKTGAYSDGFNLLISCTYIENGTTRVKFFEYLENTISNWIITKRDQDINKIIND